MILTIMLLRKYKQGILMMSTVTVESQVCGLVRYLNKAQEVII